MVLCCICELPLRAKGGKRCPHCRKVVEHETRDRAKCNGLCMGSSRRHPSQDKSKDSKDRGYCAGACAASGGTGGRGGGSKGTDSCILCKNDAQTQAKRTSGNAVMLLEKCNTGCHTSYHVHEKCRKKEIKSVRKSLSKKDKATVDKYGYNWCFLCAQGVDFHISSKSRHTGTYGTLIGQPKEIINMTDLYTIHSSVQVAVDYSDYSVTVPTTTMKKKRAAAVSSGTTFAMPDSVTCQISERTGCSCILEDGISYCPKPVSDEERKLCAYHLTTALKREAFQKKFAAKRLAKEAKEAARKEAAVAAAAAMPTAAEKKKKKKKKMMMKKKKVVASAAAPTPTSGVAVDMLEQHSATRAAAGAKVVNLTKLPLGSSKKKAAAVAAGLDGFTSSSVVYQQGWWHFSTPVQAQAAMPHLLASFPGALARLRYLHEPETAAAGATAACTTGILPPSAFTACRACFTLSRPDQSSGEWLARSHRSIKSITLAEKTCSRCQTVLIDETKLVTLAVVPDETKLWIGYVSSRAPSRRGGKRPAAKGEQLRGADFPYVELSPPPTSHTNAGALVFPHKCKRLRPRGRGCSHGSGGTCTFAHSHEELEYWLSFIPEGETRSWKQRSESPPLSFIPEGVTGSKSAELAAAPPGSWICHIASCGNINYPGRTVCHHPTCGVARQGSESPPTVYDKDSISPQISPHALPPSQSRSTIGECGICFDTVKLFHLIECDHAICTSCLDRWTRESILKNGTNSCPFCRVPIRLPAELSIGRSAWSKTELVAPSTPELAHAHAAMMRQAPTATAQRMRVASLSSSSSFFDEDSISAEIDSPPRSAQWVASGLVPSSVQYVYPAPPVNERHSSNPQEQEVPPQEVPPKIRPAAALYLK